MIETAKQLIANHKNKTPYVVSHLDAQLQAWELDHKAIERESDPDYCSPDKLPFLAFDKGVVVWHDHWSIERKRFVAKHGWTYKRIEGTPAGIEAYLNLLDTWVHSEVLPPARAFLMDDTGLDHEAILELMPQLRLYHDWPTRELPDAAMADRDFTDETFLFDDIVRYLGRYPVIWDNGVETPLQESDTFKDGDEIELYFYGDAGWAPFETYAFLDEAYLVEPENKPPFKANLADPTMSRQRLNVTLYPDEATTDDRFVGDVFVAEDLATRGWYDRLYLWEPERIPTSIGIATGPAFLDETWLGLSPYHIIMTIAMPGYPTEVPQHWQYVDETFVIDAEPETTHFPMLAALAAKRGGDRLWFQLASEARDGAAATLPTLD